MSHSGRLAHPRPRPISSRHDDSDILSTKAGIRPLIDALVTSRDFGRAKPDPAIYVEGARRLGVPLAATVMVGDRLDTDVAGALNAGIPAVWLKHPGAVAMAGIAPTHIITRLAELPGWLEATDTRR